MSQVEKDVADAEASRFDLDQITELWSPGSPVFPFYDSAAGPAEVAKQGGVLRAVLGEPVAEG